MWLYESKLGPGQSSVLNEAASRRLPQTHITLLGPDSVVRLPGDALSLVLVLAGTGIIAGSESELTVAARHFMVCERGTAVLARLQAHGLLLILSFSEAALRRLLPDAGREPLPGDGVLDRATLQRICSVLRAADATTTQFWRREPAVRALLRRITALQADLFARMSACPGKSYSRKLQVMTRMQRARIYLEAHSDRNVRIAELAELTSYSHCYFTKTFHRVYGMSPKTCATQYRLQRACRMLRDRTHSVGEVAVACGFDNQSAFARAFRQHFGVSATLARNEAVRA